MSDSPKIHTFSWWTQLERDMDPSGKSSTSPKKISIPALPITKYNLLTLLFSFSINNRQPKKVLVFFEKSMFLDIDR